MNRDAVIGLAAGHSHLFGGARLLAQGAARPLRPAAVEVLFRDGVAVAAELVATGDDDRLLLSLPAYTTAAGTTIAAALWPLTAIEDAAEGLSLTVGKRIR